MANWWDKNLTDKQKFRLQEPQDASLLNVVSAVPTPVGDVASGLLAAQDVSKGNYGTAALNALGLLPFVPSMGAITAFHGSPKELIGNKFDLSKSGSGGGNDYGFGGYLSESPSVASRYMGDEEKFITTIDGNVIDTPTMQSIIRMGGKPESLIETLSKKLESQKKVLDSSTRKEILPGLSDYDIAKLDYNSTLNKINEAKSYIGKDIKHQRAGNLYKADIADKKLPYFIDWDSQQQTPEVMAILKQAGIYQPNTRGENLYLNASQKVGGSDATKSGFQKASEYLNSIGIKGNKYTDRTYGTVAKNPTNYVVFDTDIVKMLERNQQPIK